MNNMIVSSAPHVYAKITTQRIMLDVILALIPALAVAIWVFGPRAALVIGVCVASCVFFEWAFQKIAKRKKTITDLSAVVTGILLAYNLPVCIPVWQAIFGSLVAIVLVKMIFGGLGKNFANPAITARIVMFFAFPATMTRWVIPGAVYPDALTGPTPLMFMARGEPEALPGIWEMFIGMHGGSLGETSALALLLGGLYLLARRVITWHTPVAFVGTVFIITALVDAYPVYQVLTGGLLLGAIFMATDYVTAPLTKSGRFIFGVGAALITVVIRLYGGFPEGVSFGILFMNMLVPYINKLTVKNAFGGVKA